MFINVAIFAKYYVIGRLRRYRKVPLWLMCQIPHRSTGLHVTVSRNTNVIDKWM